MAKVNITRDEVRSKWQLQYQTKKKQIDTYLAMSNAELSNAVMANPGAVIRFSLECLRLIMTVIAKWLLRIENDE